MAELKTLNGYEVVDQKARDTKQNKVLYGSSDPSNSTGSDGDVYVSTTGADVINDLQSQINTNKTNIARKVDARYTGHGFPFMHTIGNIGLDKNIIITMTEGEQFVFIIGAGQGGTKYIKFITGGNYPVDYDLGTSLTATISGSRITIPNPGWFRGLILSYLPFNVTIE